MALQFLTGKTLSIYIKLHKQIQPLKDAIATAINAGVDMSMVPNNPEYKTYCNLLVELVNEGRVSLERLDDAVRRILRVKNKLGLLKKYKKINIHQYKILLLMILEKLPMTQLLSQLLF